jgi:hypothetical protein
LPAPAEKFNHHRDGIMKAPTPSLADIAERNNRAMQDDQTLNFPAHIAEQIGLSVNEISWLRKRGCPFHGRKTSVRWVRLYLDKISGADALAVGTEDCPPHLRR